MNVIARGVAVVLAASCALPCTALRAQSVSPGAHALPVGPNAPLDAALEPPWSHASPRRIVDFAPDPRGTPVERGAELAQAVAALRPGDMLQITGGTYSMRKLFNISAAGTADAPIWITGRPFENVVITRPDERQNVINVGANMGGPARYLVLSNLEVTGGSQGIRLLTASHIWIDRCRIHHTGAAGLTANSNDTTAITITRNEIHHTTGTGEGLYLGANNGAHAMSRSLIAFNHVHHTGGRQGDGIELKQGSWGNRILGNYVHDTRWPCILVYGTDGRQPNIIERNVCWNSGDNVMQVQGEAIVRNNLLVKGAIGFHSHDHQGQSKNLIVVHNTIINVGPATDLFSWNDRPGMVFANNAVYSRAGPALSFPNGDARVTLAGNVVFGAVVIGPVLPESAVPGPAAGEATGAGAVAKPGAATRGCIVGHGLADFLQAQWTGGMRDVSPTPGGALVGAGDSRFAVPDDLSGGRRRTALDAGCLDAP